MSSPLVSIIVPNYNHASYLPARMDSILNQSFRDFEIIILDDCSTDGSRGIIESYRDQSQVSQIVFNKKNSGSPFHQWNKGIALAKGSFIWVAETDDFCQPQFLATTIKKLTDYPTAGLVYTQSVELDEITKTQYISFKDSPRFKTAFLNSYFSEGRKEVSQKLVHENTIPNASGVLFRKDVFHKVSGADESMKLCGDWFLWVKILLISDMYFIAEPLNSFRLTHSSVRTRVSKVQTFHERLRILNWMGDNGIKNVSKKERLLFNALFNNFKLNELNTPVKMIMSEPVRGNKIIKMLLPFVMSCFDRLTGKISRIQNRLAS